jgi:hypothetical protein
MISDSELLIFIRQLGKLIGEYYDCTEELIKKEIHQDILLLSSIIHTEGDDKHF